MIMLRVRGCSGKLCPASHTLPNRLCDEGVTAIHKHYTVEEWKKWAEGRLV